MRSSLCCLTLALLAPAAAVAQTPAPATTATAAPQAPRPTPPTRTAEDPGAPPFKRIPPGGHAPVNKNGNFIIGPDYPPPPELNGVEGVPQGKVQQFTISSADTRFYPGVARDVFGIVDPNNPKTLIVDTHAQAWERAITVYVPAQYQPGTRAPLIVVHDGPKMGAPDATLPHVLDNLIAQKRVPAMV